MPGNPCMTVLCCSIVLWQCLKCWKARPRPKRVYQYRTLSFAAISLLYVWSAEKGDPHQRGCTRTEPVLRCSINVLWLCLKYWKGRPRPKRVYPYRSHLMMQYLCFMFEVLKGEAQTKEGVPIQDVSYAAVSMFCGRVWSTERGDPDQRGCTHTGHAPDFVPARCRPHCAVRRFQLSGHQSPAERYCLHDCAWLCEFVRVHVCTCLCVHVCVCVYVHIHVCVYECMFVCVCAHTCVCVWVHVCVCVHVDACVCVCMLCAWGHAWVCVHVCVCAHVCVCLWKRVL